MMADYKFYKIFLIQSVDNDGLEIGTELLSRLKDWNLSNRRVSEIVLFSIDSLQDWNDAWESIYTCVETNNEKSIIHLAMQSNEEDVFIDRKRDCKIRFREILDNVSHANLLSHNNIFFTYLLCNKHSIIEKLSPCRPMPFCGFWGVKDVLNKDDQLSYYTAFYECFLNTADLYLAVKELCHTDKDIRNYICFKPEEIFYQIYLSYLETYKTDADIERMANEFAYQHNISFANESERCRFCRDYKCQLLTNEDIEYQKCVHIFFMFDLYPEIKDCFNVPRTIYEFKQYAKLQGITWLSDKRKVSDDDVKGISLDLLQRVHDFCHKYNIRYSLAYGTLLGAVRHKGFIPWDDDLDIIMLRPDYDRFIATFNKQADSRYCVASFESDPNFHYPFAKVVNNSTVNDELGYNKYGVSIDLFPIDKLPKNELIAKKLLQKQSLLWHLFMLKSMRWNKERSLRMNLLMALLKLILYFFSFSYLSERSRKLSRKYENLIGDYNLGCLFGPYGIKEIMPKEIFETSDSLLFEERYYSCLKDYDRYLSSIYGNYLQLPPLEKRVSHHSINAVWK